MFHTSMFQVMISEMHSVQSNQEEVFHAHVLEKTIYVDIGTEKKWRLVNVSEWCTTLLGFYFFTGEDCTSAFKGKGKVTLLKKLLKTPRFHKVFR